MGGMRDWRFRKSETHTREIRAEHLPREVQELLGEMVDRIRDLSVKVHALQADVDAIKAVEVDRRMLRPGREAL